MSPSRKMQFTDTWVNGLATDYAEDLNTPLWWAEFRAMQDIADALFFAHNLHIHHPYHKGS